LLVHHVPRNPSPSIRTETATLSVPLSTAAASS
jgi:hypothetical protein